MPGPRDVTFLSNRDDKCVVTPISQVADPASAGRQFEARRLTGRYLDFFNTKRPLSSHGGRTPDQAYLAPPPALAAAASEAKRYSDEAGHLCPTSTLAASATGMVRAIA
jgi:hypothetical protein